MSRVVDRATAECASCRQPLKGRYCSACGEQALEPHALTVRHFVVHTLLHELVHVDGKAWRTLRFLLFRPGFLTAEYWAGRRRLFINPVRLLVTAIIVYALTTQGGLRSTINIGRVTLSMAPVATSEGVSVQETVRRLDPFGMLSRAVAERSSELASEADRQRFHQTLEHFAQPLSFTGVLLLALVLYGLFRRRHGLFVQHGVFAMHFMSFVLLTTALSRIPVQEIMRAGYVSTGVLTSLAVNVWQFVYLTIAVRRFYFTHDTRRIRSRFLAVGAALLLFIANSMFTTGVQFAGAALALWTL